EPEYASLQRAAPARGGTRVLLSRRGAWSRPPLLRGACDRDRVRHGPVSSGLAWLGGSLHAFDSSLRRCLHREHLRRSLPEHSGHVSPDAASGRDAQLRRRAVHAGVRAGQRYTALERGHGGLAVSAVLAAALWAKPVRDAARRVSGPGSAGVHHTQDRRL
ncbi:MAG: hypothetical protein AVDCRST_MAG89-4753, partial [uncultured Gemmatimonadetes bacterium]